MYKANYSQATRLPTAINNGHNPQDTQGHNVLTTASTMAIRTY